MKKYNICRILFFLIIFFVQSCENKKKENNDNKSIDTNFVTHNFCIQGKNIQFSLPSWYTNENIEYKYQLKQYVDRDAVQLGDLVFFSTKNDDCFFVIRAEEESFREDLDKLTKEQLIDSFLVYVKLDYALRPFFTVFTEKRWDKNNNPYYFVMASSRYYSPRDFSKDDVATKLEETDLIQSEFSYIKYFGTKRFNLGLVCIENIREFSYEEKRKILESIKIE